MIATPKIIRDFRVRLRMQIDSDLEALILQRFCTEPYPHTYTQQDLYEQIRKLVDRYNELFPPVSYDPRLPFLSGPDGEFPDGLRELDTRGGAYRSDI